MLSHAEELIGYNIKTSRRIIRFLAIHLKEDGITPEQWTVLKRVGESRGISQKELSARADKDQATLTKILDLLEKKNFIRREANPRDRRSFLVVLTEAGEELKQTLTDKMEILFAGLLENTSDEDLAVFLGILDRINGNIANNTTS
ncbi:MarR family winged helix-turn-helix transcriptional regulator [Bacillus atrophaeus]|uniref:MarR family winged helix-turn-helix transcriptional regulator n=1 Tax=Bacillus atrophaeus TaxID=1452 RepID=UPI00032E4543|nr:MarR family transcriptional regulator [Bacillus atrophaeus]AKL86351.1 MarR family regulatory protein [Bacillus atrophaeus UCMB-5137]MBU5261697.1 MarR family transcriptional regulator [Bacillus atrophaeus]MCY8975363.1 MarR family transcriptional regulator [Bacillus atrophaeus]MCY9163649.1 MarR family transcriptional regulator [Bacillus atrophaeus]MDQ0929284.1 MarR family transcriptional regulator for hemolysin [Bacillus atrophaeus]